MMRQVLISIAALAVLTPFGADATLIQGELTFSGDLTPTGGSSLGSATGLHFPGSDFDVDGATGDFAAAGITAGALGSIYDFAFQPLTGPVTPLWSIGGFQFVLESISIELQTNSFLILSGTGYLTAAGFEKTAGAWNLSANTLRALFNFSSGTLAEPRSVPEPASLLLLGSGLLVAGAIKRRRRT